MHKVYLDTNVILEHAMKRENYLQVVEIFHLAESGIIKCYTSAATFFTIAFFINKKSNSKEIFKIYFSFINIIATSEGDLKRNINSTFVDIEDGFQYHSALGKCDIFLTFNKKDFARHQSQKLPVFYTCRVFKRNVIS